jgi:hypothetical protein
MITPNAETEVIEALANVGTGIFPTAWKSSIYQAAAVLSRICTPGSPYSEQAKQIIARVPAIGADGRLMAGWESPQYEMAALLTAALKDIKSGAMWRGLWDIRNEACSDLLTQADELFSKNYLAASAVLAGGALETHLKDLCVRSNLQWSGDGSISKYISVLSQAQNQGAIAFFSTLDNKMCTAWGDIRNRAAHDPATISAKDKVAIETMIKGVRDFIVRVA